MLYNKNKSEDLDINLFKNPTSKYRSAPFWAWNTRLEKDELLWQIEKFKEMGFGGFHMHSRSGLDTEYLSDEFINMVKACVKKAKKENMFAYLYDEDRWPSGFAGGLVTKDRKFAKRYLKLTVNKEESFPYDVAYNEGKTYLLAVFDIILNEADAIVSYEIIDDNCTAKGTKWYAYVCTDKPSGWYNNQSYVDVLSKDAIDKFIETTYKKYKDELGDDFGTVSPSIFTDEPATQIKVLPDNSSDRNDVILGWTMGFEDDFEKIFGYSLTEKIPELIWYTGKPSIAKYHYHRYLSERFASCYFDNIGSWCEKNGIKMTGHLNSEEDLEVQMAVTDDCMRMYKNMQLPGIDILSARLELTTAKQAHSVVNQCKKDGMCSELYGVCDWDYDFRGHKAQGDWQAAMGVTFRAHHLAWLTMKGEGKRDYPASISYQSPWYKEYKYLEDHFARLNTVLTRGEPCVNVAVIHPIETYWLYYGIKDKTCEKRKELNKQFVDTNMWLLSGLVDFDYVSESLLPEQFKESETGFQVGEMNYKAVVVLGCETLRETTVDALENFCENGGKIIFVGECPSFVEMQPTDRIKKLYDKSINITHNKLNLLNSLQSERDIDIIEQNEVRCDRLLYTLREENNCKWLFVANMYDEDETKEFVKARERRIVVNGEFTPVEYDTLNGEIKPAEFEILNGKTIIYKTFYRNDSLLLKLEEKSNLSYINSKQERTIVDEKYFLTPVEFELEEENVIVLDIGMFKIDDGKYRNFEEIRKIDRIVKEELGYTKNDQQPWTIRKEKAIHTVTVKYSFFSEIEYENSYFATEDAQDCTIVFNGVSVNKEVCGYFTDKSIEKIKLPPIVKGENTIEVTYPLARHTSLENSFVLGNFGVKLAGCTKTVVQMPEKLGFSDVVSQFMPFYGGNIIYKLPIEMKEEADLSIRINDYEGALIKVTLDNDKSERIVFSPYECSFKNVTKGQHILNVTLFGNRRNTFGAFHIINEIAPWGYKWIGPEAWEFMKDGKENWRYEYKLKPMGILSSPYIKICGRTK